MILCITAADPSLGRVDRSMLDDQTIMELLVQPGSEDGYLLHSYNRKRRNDLCFFDNGEYRDKCDWKGVLCNRDGHVTHIDWKEENWRAGSVSLDILPPKLILFNITQNYTEIFRVSGTLEAAFLPRGLTNFTIDCNEFYGTIDFGSLPHALVQFEAHQNNFTGSVAWSALPPHLNVLDISENNFEGTVVLECLPQKLKQLYAFQNKFVGTICLTTLPETLGYLDLSHNKLCGKVELGSFPSSIYTARLHGNALEVVEGQRIPSTVSL